MAGDAPDPTLALYLAYAWHDIGLRPQVQQLQQALLASFGFTLFDLAMLSGAFRAPGQQGALVLPGLPLLARGWSLLSAFNARLAPELMALQQHLRPSHWTLFDPAGTALFINAIQQGGITR